MKLRTSFFNATALKKNLVRFAPAWGLYGIFMLLLIMDGRYMSDQGFADSFGRSIAPMAIANFFYALLCAQLLFGDLYNSRMCNALHAMPLRREGWFLTNVASGMLFALIPYTVSTLAAMLLCGEFALVPLFWLCGVTMEFVFFFGVAVFSAYLVGNRFAMALVYFILNGFSIILYWLVYSIFEPMLYGVTIPQDIFVDFCPVVKLCTFEYVNVSLVGWSFETGWGFLGLCAGLGVVAFVLALLCYRKRNLETAGDFTAFRPIGAIFLVLYTICGGACCHGFFSVFVGDENEFFLFLGLAIGFFTGLMLLQRTVKVFRLKAFLGFGAVVLAMVLSVVIIRTDLLCIVGWLPETDEIKSVSITTDRVSADQLTLTEEEDLEKILQIHQYGLQNRDASTDGRRDTRVILTYTLRSGAVCQREYYVNVGTACGDMLRFYLSRPEMVLGDVYGKLDEFTLQGVELPDGKAFIVSAEALRALMDAIEADCAGGDLAQDWAYTESYGDQYWINLRFVNQDGLHYYSDIVFTQASTNLMMWYRTQLDILESVKTVE